MDEEGQVVRLELDCMYIEPKAKKGGKKKKDRMTYNEKMRDKEDRLMNIDHLEYRGKDCGPPLILHNMINTDFIRGVSKNLTCPICQDLV